MPCHKLHVPAHLHASLATPLFKKGMARFLQTNGQFFASRPVRSDSLRSSSPRRRQPLNPNLDDSIIRIWLLEII